MNTGSWSGELDQSKVVELHSNHIKIGYATFPAQTYRELLPYILPRHFRSESNPALTLSTTAHRLLLQELEGRPQKAGSKRTQALTGQAEDQRKEAESVPDKVEQAAEDEKWGKDAITHQYLWPRVSKFFRNEDIILAEAGTSAFGEST